MQEYPLESLADTLAYVGHVRDTGSRALESSTLTQLFLNKLTGKYSERRRMISVSVAFGGQRRDEHEEATYFGAGNSARCVFRGISRSSWQ